MFYNMEYFFVIINSGNVMPANKWIIKAGGISYSDV